jgi:intracellular sulfur oxidation DsrE/DsrF family protein
MWGIRTIGVVVALAGALGGWSASRSAADELRIDVPVHLKSAKVVFNIDHLVFEGDQPTGLIFMRLLSRKIEADHTPSSIVAIFHGPAGYMLLDDATYDRERRTSTGNLYRRAIAELQQAGIQFEECGQTAREGGWGNADFLPGVKINEGANFRIIELVQEGYVQIQP